MKPSLQNDGPGPRGVWGGLLSPYLPMGVLALGCFGLGLGLGGDRALDASPLAAAGDTDGDGLSDLLEQIRWSDPLLADTDGDGFGDLEELARHSDPVDHASVPGIAPHGTSVGLATFVEEGKLKTQIVLYSEHGALFGSELTLGVAIGGTLIELPPAVYLSDASVAVHPAAHADARLVVVESRMPEGIVHALGDLSVYATVGPAASLRPTAADTLELSVEGGVVLEYVDVPDWLLGGSGADEGGGATFASQASTQIPTSVSVTPPTGAGPGGASGTGLYRPIAGNGSVPSSWASNKVCIQLTNISGGSGGVLTTEVVQASCQEIDDVGCSASSCASKVGTTKEVIDPTALIGG